MKIKKDIIARDIQGETVLLNLKSGDYFSLNTVGTDIFSCIQKEMDEEKIIDFLIEKYDVEKDILKNDVSSLFIELKDNNILE